MIQSYRSMEVTTNWATPNPGVEVQAAMDMTMKRSVDRRKPVSAKSLRFLFSAEHTEVVEHAIISFTFENISRSLLAQVTRQRLASKTSASQHYQNYSAYKEMVSQDISVTQLGIMVELFRTSDEAYTNLINDGMPKEEARQVLTNAKAVNLMYTTNASALYVMFRKRSCLRNVEEMLILMYKMWVEVQKWWPEYADILGPPCYLGKCNQGYMGCGKVWQHFRSR